MRADEIAQWRRGHVQIGLHLNEGEGETVKFNDERISPIAVLGQAC